jgi:uncharacterized protein HemX
MSDWIAIVLLIAAIAGLGGYAWWQTRQSAQAFTATQQAANSALGTGATASGAMSPSAAPALSSFAVPNDVSGGPAVPS